MSMSTRTRWMVPVAVSGLVAAAFAGPALFASASSSQPSLTPEQLLTKVGEADPVPLSGTAVYTARLGLPEIPLQGLRNAGPIDLLSGSSTIRVWSDGAEKSRTALVSSLSEYSVVHDGTQAWAYSSGDNTAVHYTLSPEAKAEFDAMKAEGHPGMAGKGLPGATLPGATLPGATVASEPPSPQAAADQFLAEAGKSTNITVGSETKIAGRDAYQLGLVPKTKDTLIGRVLIAVDAKTFTPLRVQVWSTKDPASPAIELGFTDVNFSAPDASVFTFSAPKGAKVKNVEIPAPDAAAYDQADKDQLAKSTKVLGEGWGTVVEVNGVDLTSVLPTGKTNTNTPAPSDASGADGIMGEFHKDGASPHGDMGLNAASILSQITTKVPQGQVISSNLLSVLITDDGHLFAGAVPTETLLNLAK